LTREKVKKKLPQHVQRTDDFRIPESIRFKPREREGRNRKAKVSDLLNIAGEILAVVRTAEFLAADPEVPGSIPGATRFWEK
jgi:hypothetical protein